MRCVSQLNHWYNDLSHLGVIFSTFSLLMFNYQGPTGNGANKIRPKRKLDGYQPSGMGH